MEQPARRRLRVYSQATIVPHGREGSALLESVAIDSFAPLGWLVGRLVGRYTSDSLRCIFSVIVVGVPSEAVRTMADPRGGRREKVKINENSSSVGAIEKLPGAARGTWVRARVWDLLAGVFFSVGSPLVLCLSVLHSSILVLLSVSRLSRIPHRVPHSVTFRCANSTVEHAPFSRTVHSLFSRVYYLTLPRRAYRSQSCFIAATRARIFRWTENVYDCSIFYSIAVVFLTQKSTASVKLASV